MITFVVVIDIYTPSLSLNPNKRSILKSIYGDLIWACILLPLLSYILA